LTAAGYRIDGTDIQEKNVEIAKQKGYIAEKAGALDGYDVVFIAVPPNPTISILQNTRFKKGALVCDICGIKEKIEKAVYATPKNYRYVGMHPMAGKETSGIESASSELFRMANLIITISDKTEGEAVVELEEYAKAMRFGKIVKCSAQEHDKKIALTSQLAHLVSSAYVKSPEVQDCDGFTGGSFQDMTRIAGVDERIWSELYLFNRDYILQELDEIIAHLTEYRVAIEGEDKEALSEALKEGRLIRENIKYKKK
jgi:prephenate dehydrogenase